MSSVRTFAFQFIPVFLYGMLDGYVHICLPYEALHNRAYHTNKISSNFLEPTYLVGYAYIYGIFWIWRIFFIFRWVKMPPKGYNETKYKKPYISWSLCIFE